MDFPLSPLASLSVAAMIDRLKRLAAIERRATALTLAHLIKLARESDGRVASSRLGTPARPVAP